MAITVTRLRYTANGTDARGDTTLSATADELAINGCGIAPRTEGENTEDGRQGVLIGWDLYAPHGADIEPTDLIRLPGGETYRVDGEPAEWTHMHTNWQAGTVVALARYEG